jgi:DNA-binding NarL/FixJ family response regulator
MGMFGGDSSNGHNRQGERNMKRLDEIPGSVELDSARTRAIAAGADGLAQKSMALAELWRLLVTGALRVVDTFHTDERCYLTLASPATVGKAPRRLSARKVETLQRILLGERQKTVALDCNLAASTIALTVAECLRTLGLDSRTARVPSLVALAAHAASGQTDVLECRISEFPVLLSDAPELEAQASRSYKVVSVARPDLDIGSALSGAEYAVARLLVEGKSYAEMALLRGTSVRTVANQVASVFQKIGVSGRSEFLSALIRHGALLGTSPSPLAEGLLPNAVAVRRSRRRTRLARPVAAARHAEAPSVRWEPASIRDGAPNSSQLEAR